MNRRTAPGFGQWIIVAFMIAGVTFLLFNLYRYGLQQDVLPAGLEIAGVNVGGLTEEAAELALTNTYYSTGVTVRHRSDEYVISPAQAEFALDFETMMARAEYEQEQQNFWDGFWGFLWGRPIEVEPVQIVASYNENALREVLQIIAQQYDAPAQPPQPLPGTMSFQYGAEGISTDINASIDDVAAALFRPRDREAVLVVELVDSQRPDIELLERLVTNNMQEFEQINGAVASVYILDVDSGQEITYNADIPMSGMSVLKIPILTTLYAFQDQALNANQANLVQSAITEVGDTTANELLTLIAGQNDGYLGSDLVSGTMIELGLVNTFLVAPFGEDARRDKETLQTPANVIANPRIAPDPMRQTTAEDMGTLLSMIYYCATVDGGALRAAFGDRITQTECQEIIAYLSGNRIRSLIEEGVPQEYQVAHRHGWSNDTYGDAGIVYSPNGTYIIVEFTHRPNSLRWEVSSPLMADISRAAYNYVNFDDPYLGGISAPN